MGLTSAAVAASAPGATALTVEYANDFLATQAATWPSTGLTAHGTAVSNATTNTPLVSTAAITLGSGAGTVWNLKAWGIYSTPASAPATLSFICYSGGSGGTALATIVAFTPTVSMTNAIFDVEAWVDFYSATAAQCLVKAFVNTSNSVSTGTAYIAAGSSTSGTTITDGSTLTLNAVMGSAVSGSSFEGLGGYAKQTV
jgi:hypothetical protein